MKKYAIKHKDGFLVRSIGDFIGISTSSRTAMSFSSREAARETTAYLNKVTSTNGGRYKNPYSVCDTSKYVKPTWAKKKNNRPK